MQRMKNLNLLLPAIFAMINLGCNQTADMKSLPTRSSDGNYNAVIEIPAGTNRKIEYDTHSKAFKTDQRDGKDRIIGFLSYPANYGFIPSTLSDRKKGGDGDPVDILVICESQKTGTVLAINPIAMLKLMDNGEEDFKVLAVPADANLNPIGVTTLEALKSKHPAILEIIEKWFLSYDTEPASSLGWANGKETLNYIRNNTKK